MAISSSEQPPRKTAMEIALEEARQKNGKWKPEKSVDEVALDTEAVDRWEGEGGRVVEESERDIAETLEPKVIPPELEQIYGGKIPPGVLEMYGKLKGKKKRESYLATLQNDRRKKEKAFDPHSVRSTVTVDEQKNVQETLRNGESSPKGIFKRKGILVDKDMNVRDVQSPFDVNPEMQREMDKLASQEETLSEKPPEMAATTPTPAEVAPEVAFSEPISRTERINQIKAKLAEGYDDRYAGIAQDPELGALQMELEQLEREEAESVEMPKIIPDPEQALDPEHAQEMRAASQSEGTRKDWQDKLRALIMGATEKTKEKFEWWKSAEEGLVRRSKDLDTQLEKIGGTEKAFRWLGEQYNKAGWKTKLGVGLALGIGAGVSAPVNMGVAAGLLLGVGVQRVAGLATMYLKFEKNSHDKKYGKEQALLKAVGYSLLMAGAMYGVEKGALELSASDMGHHTREWLYHHLPSWAGGEASVSATASAASDAAPTPGQSPMSAPAMPEITASPGHGYEWAAKRAWEQLQEHPVDVSKYAENSDIRQLAEATPESINKVVHDLATSHHFYSPNGESVQIDPSAHFSFSAEGQLPDAPTGAHMTPPYVPHAEASAGPVGGMTPVEAGNFAPTTAPEGAVQELPEIKMSEPEGPPAVDVTNIPQGSVEHPAPTPENFLVDSQGHVVTDSQGQPVHTGSYEAPPTQHVETTAPHAEAPQASSNISAELNPNTYINSHGTSIDPGTVHGYLSGKDIYAFGGDKLLDVQAQNYAQEHHVSVFVDKSYKLLGLFNVSRVVEYVPSESGPPVMVIHNDPSLIPDPKNFTKRIF